MRAGKGYALGAVEKGGDANVAKKQKLTEKQRAFCRFYTEGFAPKEAAEKAGYRNARTEGWRLMQKEYIQKRIQRLERLPLEAAGEDGEPAEKEEILCFLTEVMRDSEEADLKTRMKAAELLGKRESLFQKEKEAEEGCRVVIVDDIP